MECPICKSKTKELLKVPFGKNCESMPIKDYKQISYHQCSKCRYIFAPEFLSWTENDFKKKIYNDEYEIYDPEFRYKRPYHSMLDLYNEFKGKKHLDYGGGNGMLSQLLNDREFNSTSYDIFYHNDRPKEKFDIVTCIEVIEHSIEPLKIFDDIKSLLKDNGKLIISTLIMDYIKNINDHWYISPRNGHIGFYFTKTLRTIADISGYKYIEDTHTTKKEFIKL